MSLAGLGDAEGAIRLAAAAQAELERLALDVRVRFWLALNAEHFGAARRALGEEATRGAEEAGRAMSFEQAIVLATGAAGNPDAVHSGP